MNQITPVPARVLGVHVVHGLPGLSRETELAVSAVADPTPGIAYPRPSPSIIAEARRVLPAVEAALRPLGFKALLPWLELLGSGVAFRPGEEGMRLFASAAATASADLPECVLDRLAYAAALRAFDVWPSAAKLDAFLRDRARPITARLEALRKIAAMGALEPEPEPRELTQAESDAIVARVRREMRGDLPAPRPARPREDAKPATLAQATALTGRRLSQEQTVAVFLEDASPDQIARAQAAFAARRGETAGTQRDSGAGP